MKDEQKHQREYIAFEGEKFTIEWYFDTKGTSDALNYFESLNFYNQVKVIDLFKLMGNNGHIRNKTKFNYEGEKIYAFKPQPHRFLCFFFTGYKIVVTNAFHKKTDKLPKNEKAKALKVKDDYEIRIKQGDYYE